MVRDMTVGSPSKIIIGFALPMIFGNIFQQMYNIVDSVVVGNLSVPTRLPRSEPHIRLPSCSSHLQRARLSAVRL